jgi:sirohydrochlorin cobaltochelatase
MQAAGYENVFVGTVEGFPALENVMANVTAYGASKIVLYPFMVVAGDHASNDMAGDEEDSWKVILTDAGFEVECVLEGLGQNAGIRAIYIDHIKAAIAEAGL